MAPEAHQLAPHESVAHDSALGNKSCDNVTMPPTVPRQSNERASRLGPALHVFRVVS